MTREIHGLVSEIVRPHQDPLEAVVDSYNQPAVAEAAMAVAWRATEANSVNELVLAGIVAAYATPANSYNLNTTDGYLDLAVRAASGLVTLKETLPQDEGHYELVMVVPEVGDGITGGIVGRHDLAPSILNNASNGLQASVDLRLSAASKATERPGTALVNIAKGTTVTVLKDGSHSSVASLEAAVANNGWLTVGGEAVRERLGPLTPQERLMALTALRASGVNTAHLRCDGCNIESETRDAVVRDMTRLLLEVAIARSYTRRDAADTPPEVSYDQPSMLAMCEVLGIDRNELNPYATDALRILMHGPHDTASATTLAFASHKLHSLLRDYPS